MILPHLKTIIQKGYINQKKRQAMTADIEKIFTTTSYKNMKNE